MGNIMSDLGETSFDAGTSEAGGTATSAGNVPLQDAPAGAALPSRPPAAPAAAEATAGRATRFRIGSQPRGQRGFSPYPEVPRPNPRGAQEAASAAPSMPYPFTEGRLPAHSGDQQRTALRFRATEADGPVSAPMGAAQTAQQQPQARQPTGSAALLHQLLQQQNQLVAAVQVLGNNQAQQQAAVQAAAAGPVTDAEARCGNSCS